MSSTLILFKEIGRQLLIVGLVLGSLPMAIRILWKLRLLPLGCYFVATKLFWPRWAAAHKTACILICYQSAAFSHSIRISASSGVSRLRHSCRSSSGTP